jgi:DNA mismatch repair protein MutS
MRKVRNAVAPHEDRASAGGAARPDVVPADSDAVNSPLIAQYLELKRQYPEALLLSRVGDFYEAYGDDADDLAASVHIVLTSKEAGKGKRVAMAGVPHHNLDHYLARLIRQQRVIAIAEQMEPPAPNRLVRREIIRVITPGTVLEDHLLASERNNYLCAVATAAGHTAVVAADVSTGGATVSVADGEDELAAELDRASPAEVVVESGEDAVRMRSFVGAACRVAAFAETELPEAAGRDEAASRDELADRATLEAFAIDERPAVRAALELIAGYLDYVRLDGAGIAARARPRVARTSMLIDPGTRRHLDLVSGAGENSRASLLNVLMRTKTPMGSRMLTQWLCAPLLDLEKIRYRHDRVEHLVGAPSWRLALQEALARIGDVERIVQKVRSRRAGPRDLAALRASLRSVERLRDALAETTDEALARMRDPLEGARAQERGTADSRPQEAGTTASIADLLERAIADEPPALITDGGAIRPEHSPELRDLVDLRTRSRDHLLGLEERTRARTGIKSLKIKYTQAFGYYYEVTRANADAVPADFVRRQTLVNAERFTDAELRTLEAEILSARSRQVAIEKELFETLLAAIDAVREALLETAEAVAELDVYAALAQAAGERRYVRPAMVTGSELHVCNGRHPIVEAYGGVDFVPNDCTLDAQRRFLLITGPNMGGKSTYLRQTALLAILAQMGSFVPADSATMGVIERLFTRIGAGDDIAAGRSTFYVEMAEMALVLRGCTPASLLLIDEVGRGTGTTDGLAIAQAVSEYLLSLDQALPMVLFATHFHELVRLSGRFPAVENLHVAVADEPGGPVFSHRLLHGSSSRSYGIAVAKMAGLPPEVVQRAQQIADDIERRPGPAPSPLRRRADPGQPDSQLALDVEP